MGRVSRRSFLEKAGITLGSLSQASIGKGSLPSGGTAKGFEGKDEVRYGVERCVVEWAYISGIAYSDPFNDLELDVVVTDPQGNEQRVPAFWAGEQVWPIRYAPATTGQYTYRILEASRQEAERFVFWTSILNGAGGHTYGANGIWQVNTAGRPFGPSPHGRCWGNTPWDVAVKLPGSAQLGLGKGLLMRYPWWRFEPHPEWVDPQWSKENYEQPYAAGIAGQVRVIFIPPMWDPPRVKYLESGVTNRAFYFDPVTGIQHEPVEVMPDAGGAWQAPITPTFADWIIVLQKV